jgi:hypothetical protein
MKNRNLLIVIAAVLYIGISASLLLIINDKTTNFWIGYVMFTLSVVMLLAAILFVRFSKLDINPKVSLVSLSAIYLMTSSLFSIVFGWILLLSMNWFIAGHILLFSIFVAFYLIIILGKRHIDVVSDNQEKRNEKIMKGFER